MLTFSPKRYSRWGESVLDVCQSQAFDRRNDRFWHICELV